MDVSLIELWSVMSWFVRGVVLVLLIMSLHAASIGIGKYLELRAARRATDAFTAPFTAALERRDLADAQRIISEHPRSHVASSLAGVLGRLALRGGSAGVAVSRRELAAMERLMDADAMARLARLRRGLGGLATVGATAPFVGLLGTTMGVVHAFTGMAAAGSAGLGAISAGIAEALVVTALGLIVAIPAVWLYNHFVNRLDEASLEITYSAAQLRQLLLDGGGRAAIRDAANGDAATGAARTPAAAATGGAPSTSSVC